MVKDMHEFQDFLVILIATNELFFYNIMWTLNKLTRKRAKCIQFYSHLHITEQISKSPHSVLDTVFPNINMVNEIRIPITVDA